MKKTNRNKIVFWCSTFVLFFTATMIWNISKPKTEIFKTSSDLTMKTFTLESIREFDGTDNNKPIYIAMNGLVYDVSAGREFYNTEGPYHYLAGKDSSTELNLVGGSIIKRKYPVIGKLIRNEK